MHRLRLRLRRLLHQPKHPLIVPHGRVPRRRRQLAPALIQARSDLDLHALDGLQHRAGLVRVRLVAVHAVEGADGRVARGEDERVDLGVAGAGAVEGGGGGDVGGDDGAGGGVVEVSL